MPPDPVSGGTIRPPSRSGRVTDRERWDALTPSEGHIRRTSRTPDPAATVAGVDELGNGFHEIRVGVRPTDPHAFRFASDTTDIDLRDLPALAYLTEGRRVLMAVIPADDLLDLAAMLASMALENGADPAYARTLGIVT